MPEKTLPLGAFINKLIVEMKKIFIFSILLLFIATPLNAQTKRVGLVTDLAVASVKLNSAGYNIGLLTITPFYRLNKNLSVGVGAGFLLLDDVDRIGMPLYGYGRWNFSTQKRVTPFVSAKVGYGIISENEKYNGITWDEDGIKQGEQVDRSFTGGVYASFSAGILYHLRKNRALSFAITPKLQKMRAKDNTSKELDFKTNFNNLALSLDVGFVF